MREYYSLRYDWSWMLFPQAVQLNLGKKVLFSNDCFRYQIVFSL